MIKICGIVDVPTAIVAAEAGATAIGLVFADSPRRVSIQVAADIARSLRGVEIIGVFRASDLPLLPHVLRHVDLHAIQMHGVAAIPQNLNGREVIPGIRTGSNCELPHKRILVDSPKGEGSGMSWDYGTVAPLAAQRRVILAGGLSPDNVAEAVSRVRPYGVDVSSGVESSPGIKDPAKILDFVQAARTAGVSS